MPAFKDLNGREWIVRFTPRIITDIQQEIGVNPVSITDPIFPKLADNLAMLVNCLWIVCRKQAQSMGVTDEQFGEALCGDPLDHASKAFVDGLLDFFPLSIREGLRAVSRQDEETRGAAMQMIEETLKDPKQAAAIMERKKSQMRRLMGILMPSNGATDSPASSDANQTTEPLPNSG